MLAFPDPRRLFILDTDTINMGFSAVLSQDGEHGEQVITHFSLSLCYPLKVDSCHPGDSPTEVDSCCALIMLFFTWMLNFK